MQTQNKKLEFPNVPVKFPGRFPEGHVNNLKGWNFSRAEVLEAGREGKMLTIDIDMGGSPKCSLRCGHCFNPVLRLLEKQGELLSEDEIRRFVLEAKELGLRTMKIVGPGEPLEEKTLLGFLGFLAENGIQPMLFTKAAILADERRARAIHGMGPEELVRRLKDEFNVSVCFGANSFDPRIQAGIVKKESYPEARNRALELLAATGFNEFVPGEPTRLAIILNPILRDNVDEIFEAYVWARRRHIYVVSSPLIVTGPRRPESSLLYTWIGSTWRRGVSFLGNIVPEAQDLFEAYVKVNLWAIENGIFSIDDLRRNGVAAYAGGQTCQQLGLGLFVRRDGVVLRCPGDDTSVHGKVREKSLAEIWHGSENYNRYRGLMNVHCPPKEQGGTFPERFFERVLEEVQKRIQQE
jgi:MoaA/NifB/PqqE/SkfB family radical SAM enzyme